MAAHTIARTAAASGVSTDTLRYYERLGLLAPPDRTANGYRVNDASTPERVRLIKAAPRLGLRLGSIRDLLIMLEGGACPCGHTRTLVEQRVTEIDTELQCLQRFRDDLLALVEDLDACPDPPSETCWCHIVLDEKGGGPRCR